jgi:HEPN domain-containing protein
VRLEAERLLVQAEEDLVTAAVLLKEERFYAAAFFAHQAAEKALKALHIQRLLAFPRSHDLLSLAEHLQAPEDVQEEARLLTPDYTLSRYPDAAGTVPAKLYGKPQATARVKAAERILEWVKAEISTS